VGDLGYILGAAFLCGLAFFIVLIRFMQWLSKVDEPARRDYERQRETEGTTDV
jgi:hypothetical protein